MAEQWTPYSPVTKRSMDIVLCEDPWQPVSLQQPVYPASGGTQVTISLLESGPSGPWKRRHSATMALCKVSPDPSIPV